MIRHAEYIAPDSIIITIAGRTLSPDLMMPRVLRWMSQIRNAINTVRQMDHRSDQHRLKKGTQGNLRVELKFVNNVSEKKETIHCWSEWMKTGSSGDALAKPCNAPMATPKKKNRAISFCI